MAEADKAVASRIAQIEDEIADQRTFLECAASEDHHYILAQEHINALQQERTRLRQAMETL